MQNVTGSRKRSNEFAEELLHLSNKLTGISHEEIDDAIKNTITRLGVYLQMDHAFHIAFDLEKGGLTAAFEWCNEGKPSMTDQMLKTTFDDFGSILETLSHNECVLLPSIQKHLPKSWKAERALFERNGFQSIILFPVMHESKLMGFIGLDSITEAKKFTSAEIYLLKVWGSMLSALLKNKRFELLLQQKQENAERSNRAKSEFLSRMSHELRTPLNSIIGFAQLLEITPLNEPQKKSVAHIRTSGDYLLNLINEVLDITRIEAGKLKLNLEPVRIDCAILEMLDVIQSQAENRNIRFLTEFKAEAFQISTDALRFRQIMLNLLNNAVKYNRVGGEINIKAECASLSTNGEPGVLVSVRDSGYGIHPEKLPLLFNPFERAGAEYSETEGTGLGLAVVKKLVTILGGEVFVESVLDKGSTFWIELPFNHPDQDTHCSEAPLAD